MSRLILIPLAALVVACGSPRYLQYDYGRAFTAATSAQADLTRASVQDVEYPLAGLEAEAIRLRVQEAVTEQKTGEITTE